MISELQRLNSRVEHVFKKLRGCSSAFPPQNNAEIENWGVAFRMTVKLFFRPCSDDHRATGQVGKLFVAGLNSSTPRSDYFAFFPFHKLQDTEIN
jgi:hypothetical protein